MACRRLGVVRSWGTAGRTIDYAVHLMGVAFGRALADHAPINYVRAFL